jgi:DtxR family Mn-dependent transcriptional regulator
MPRVIQHQIQIAEAVAHLAVELAEAEEGRFTIRKVINASPELLTYLNQKSLVPGQSFTVLEKAPFQGPLKLQIRGKTSPTYVGHEVANCIFVCRATNGTRRPHGSKRTLLVLAGKKITSRKKGK